MVWIVVLGSAAIGGAGMEDVWDVNGRALDLSAADGSLSADGPGDVAAVIDAASDAASSVLASEVRRARALGWVPLHEAPLYQLVPAAWPPTLRSWLHDPRRIDDDDEHHHERAAGLPPAPSERLWLLRSPWPDLPVYVIYELLRTRVERRDPREVVSMYRAASEVVRWSRAQVWQAYSQDTRQLLEAWREVGRSGASIEQLVEVELTPAGLAQWTAATGLTESLVVEWLLKLNAAPDEESLRFVTDWLAAGLSPRPPRDVDMYAQQDPRQLRRWLDAGFTVDEAIASEGDVALAAAITWRDEGFTFADAQELLHLDPELSPAEALAFATVGISDSDRRTWVNEGFTAKDAAAWASKGLDAAHARLWRARGLRADDVGSGENYPPDLFPEPGYYPLSALEQIPDPPGIRGAAGQTRRGG